MPPAGRKAGTPDERKKKLENTILKTLLPYYCEKKFKIYTFSWQVSLSFMAIFIKIAKTSMTPIAPDSEILQLIFRNVSAVPLNPQDMNITFALVLP